MFNNLGLGGVILILMVGLIVFGPSDLSRVGKIIGRTLNEFKKTAKAMMTVQTKHPSKKHKETFFRRVYI